MPLVTWSGRAISTKPRPAPAAGPALGPYRPSSEACIFGSCSDDDAGAWIRCDIPAEEGDRACWLHGYWARVVLADDRYRYELEAPTPEQVLARIMRANASPRRDRVRPGSRLPGVNL